MKRHASPRSVVLLVIAGTLVWMAGAGPAASRGPTKPQAEADPYADRTVLIEAFVVQMDVSLLGEMGVSPLGLEPRTVSAEGILKQLDSGDRARVLLAARTAGAHDTGRNETAAKTVTYNKREQEINQPSSQRHTKDYVPYDSGQTFTVEPTILSGSSVRLAYDFRYDGIQGPLDETDAPPDLVSWSWHSLISLKAGEPRIAGGMQDGKTATFLILTAHILD